MSTDGPKLKLKVEWKLEKFDGEVPREGESKAPVEVIQGSATLPLSKEAQNALDQRGT